MSPFVLLKSHSKDNRAQFLDQIIPLLLLIQPALTLPLALIILWAIIRVVGPVTHFQSIFPILWVVVLALLFFF